MPNSIAQAVFLICWCELWFHYFAQLTSPLVWLLQFPIFYNYWILSSFRHLGNSAHSFCPFLRFILILSFLCHHSQPYLPVSYLHPHLSLIFIKHLRVLISTVPTSTYFRKILPCTHSCLFNSNLTQNKITFYFLLLSSINLSPLFYLWPWSFLTLERTLQVMDSHVNNTVTKQMKTSLSPSLRKLKSKTNWLFDLVLI